MKREILSKGAPSPVGPYSQAVEEAGFVYCSGQLGLNPETGSLEEGITSQTRRALDNLSAVLKEAGLSMDDVVKTSVFLSDMGNYPKMNEEYSKHFRQPFPARTAVQASLPRGGLVEIDAVARRESA